MPAPESSSFVLSHPDRLARVHVFSLHAPEGDPRPTLAALRGALDLQHAVVGFGAPLLVALGRELPGLRAFPALAGPGVAPPSTQGALFCVLGGEDRGELLHRSRKLCALLAPVLAPAEVVDTFTHLDGRDLSGYVDGTENPKGQAAIDAAIVQGEGPGLDGGTFVAFQRWVHDLDALERHAPAERDAIIGRGLDTNEELASAPSSAHVKRSAQESFEPPAFMLRRSMPYVGHGAAGENGLCFIAYGESLDRFERVLSRMLGREDGVTDALFRFTRPVSGGYYFCPPLAGGQLDLRALGL
jgi:putative iron-dependent peroxidase